MKKLLFFLPVIVFCLASMGQSLKPFKVDLGLGMSPKGDGRNGTILFVEPGYRFAGVFKAGIRLEAVFANMKEIDSKAVTLDYYYLGSKHEVRPFIGAAVVDNQVTASGGCAGGSLTYQTLHTTKPLGTMFRTGFEANFFRMDISYHFLADTFVNDVDISGKSVGVMNYKNGFFALTAGISIGGGKKKIKKAD